jgi:hypothetical protein
MEAIKVVNQNFPIVARIRISSAFPDTGGDRIVFSPAPKFIPIPVKFE